MTTLLLIVGLLLILAGANYMTDGSAEIAARMHISEFIIGLTVVAIGTSMPELVVSLLSALSGSGDMAVGNIVGSNIFNTLVILGLCALVRPVLLTQANIYRDIPFGILAAVALVIVTVGGEITRLYGVLLLCIYIAIMLYAIRRSRPSKEERLAAEQIATAEQAPLLLSLVKTFGGIAALIYGGNLFLDSAVELAHHFNIPDNVIAITLLAGGTSMPELAASLVSLIKGKSDIALGNIIGSNIANILLVLGVSSTITPLTLGSITMVDIGITTLSAVLLFVAAFTFRRREIDRYEGAIFLLLFGGYLYYLVG